MARLLQFPWGLVALSSTVSVASGVAILAFEAPPAILILASWVTATFYLEMRRRIDRRLGRR